MDQQPLPDEQPIDVDPTTVEITGYAHVTLPDLLGPGLEQLAQEQMRIDDGE